MACVFSSRCKGWDAGVRKVDIGDESSNSWGEGSAVISICLAGADDTSSMGSGAP